MLLWAIALLLLASCGGKEITYKQISAQEAKELMDTQEAYTVLDVRTQAEFATGHIQGALLIPDFEIEARAEQELPDKQRLILVYCRSGRRSKLAAEALVTTDLNLQQERPPLPKAMAVWNKSETSQSGCQDAG